MRIQTGNAAGFTLLELLVSLVIASLALTLVGPRLASVVPGVQLKTETNKVAALLKHARSRAIAEGNIIGVYLKKSEESSSLRQTNSARTYRWPESIRLEVEYKTRFRDKPNGVYFYPDGSSSGGLLTLSDGDRRFRIRVNWLTGGVRIND